MSAGQSSLRPDLHRTQLKLDGLARGAVVVDSRGDAWQEGFPGYWYRAYDGEGKSSFQLAQIAESVRVLSDGIKPGTGRFDPTVPDMRFSLVWAQERAERLAGRIVSARDALRAGRSAGMVLSILDGADEERVERPRPAVTLDTPITDGLLDFGDWDGAQ